MNRTSKPHLHIKKKSKTKPKLEIRHPRFSCEVDIFENNEAAKYLIGSPNFRTARGRSGLGNIESQDELSYIQGVMISWLITGKFHRTREPFALLGMLLIGIFLSGIPLILILMDMIFSQSATTSFLLIVNIPNFALGFAALIGAIINLGEIVIETIHSFSA